VKLSLVSAETRSVHRVAELAERAERFGFHGLFLGTAFGFDPITALAIAGTRTSRLMLGTSIVPTWTRHPLVMAQDAATANAACGGRFRLGIGPSHPFLMQMLGVDYARPVGHVREYVTIVKRLLADGQVHHDGDRYRLTAFLDVEDGGQPPVLLAALREQMCRAAGALADGVLPWLAPPTWVEQVIVPTVRAGADAAGRPAPPIIATIPCYYSSDRDAVRDAARRDLAVYAKVATYTEMLDTAGVPDAAGAPHTGWSDAMIDAVVPAGNEPELGARLQAYIDAGASEVAVSPFGCGPDPEQNLEECWEVLGGIARG
jgi:5,10-methylenetetrahydromethanopterin reductase